MCIRDSWVGAAKDGYLPFCSPTVLLALSNLQHLYLRAPQAHAPTRPMSVAGERARERTGKHGAWKRAGSGSGSGSGGGGSGSAGGAGTRAGAGVRLLSEGGRPLAHDGGRDPVRPKPREAAQPREEPRQVGGPFPLLAARAQAA
eukprot:4223292-Prymnesium_polylepis.1